MNAQKVTLSAGLYFVATPIGAARDITLRALDVLASADIIAAEDTRTARKLMDIHGVPLGERKLIAYHDHSADQVADRLVQEILAGRSVAYASEAGTPLVSDPGYALSRAAIAAGVPVTSAPGPSAMIAALTIAGLPTDRFLFAGFPPSGKSARLAFLNELSGQAATVVLYDSPKRVQRLLTEMVQTFGGDRRAAVCRELTKKFEEVSRGTLAELAAEHAERTVKGEIVVLVEKAEMRQADAGDMEAALKQAMAEMSVKDAAAQVAADLGLPKRQVYQAALALGKKG